ncbi:hypothetical protein GUITHDRAFT_153897 [Guillardia theta CCMP2712]|uniref:Uncharacterized protein n=1 Tax=Guillardia theta (strain CCMP2712) TaxID=905079 RepID=L1IZC9_GUITC|nr:hypothetical protein GUITHDRAFT_153897 [Guillardia theta CCMP2712]EKX41249.1 hypothetical protein GUITHDRAFT_153897 [Guillardia theta CCMP2712]|eukprot:XP_005828229.1 hypothetical protein GUITHDRAFT_153897 [Guillardia theta CCMP2712]
MKMMTLRLSPDLQLYNFSTWTYSFDLSFAKPDGELLLQSGDLGLYVLEMYSFWSMDQLHALQYIHVSQRPILLHPLNPSQPSATSAFQCLPKGSLCLKLRLSFPRVQVNGTGNYLVDLRLQLACVLWTTDVSSWSFDACELSSLKEENQTFLSATCACSRSGTLVVVQNLRHSEINPALGLMPKKRQVGEWPVVTTSLFALLSFFLVALVMFRNNSLNSFLDERNEPSNGIQHEFQTLIGDVVFGTLGNEEKKQIPSMTTSHYKKEYSRLHDDYLDDICQSKNFYHSIWFKEGVFCKTLRKFDSKGIRRKKCKVPDTSYKLT